MDKIYMIGSQKGGTTKTTTTFNLAYCLGKMVLDDTIGHLMMAQIEDMELPSPKKYIRTKDGVDFISSSIYLSVVDAKLRLEMGTEKMLSGILEPLRSLSR